MSENNLIWYASYGSNINKDRFNCYILGGTPNFTEKKYLGCTDKTLPLENEEIYIKGKLYFAKSSTTWGGGGVAFLESKFGQDSETWGRMYLITQQQFIEVIEQENSRTNIQIDFDRAKIEDYVFEDNCWYGRIIFLGYRNEHAIFTFTHERDLTPNKPSPQYLKTIATGIGECYPFSEKEIAEYLLSKKGVHNNYSIKSLEQIISS